MKNINKKSVSFFISGFLVIVSRSALGAMLWNTATSCGRHRCVAYGDSTARVKLLGLKLYHVESCENVFLVIGAALVVIGLLVFVKEYNDNKRDAAETTE